jgi:DNA-binding NtrC family response regulator
MQDFSELNLIGQSPAFLSALYLIKKFAACDVTVLVQGETGTGKELAARAIHYLSMRQGHPFIPVNCGAMPDSLIESEMFGHERGAFTDAKSSRAGLVAEAAGGSLFLDEVETLSRKAQVTLLRFLQDKEYRPVGGKTMRLADVRIIAASNENLPDLVAEGLFRQDLLFRLNAFSVSMPPLRERQSDALFLAQAFIRRFTDHYHGESKMLDQKSISFLMNYGWPGNVRELENMIHREYVMADGNVISFEVGAASILLKSISPRNGECFRQAKARAIADFERAYVADLLAKTNGSITLAAHLSGKDRSAFGKLVKKYRIDRQIQKTSTARD